VWLGFVDKPKASLITAGLTLVLFIFVFLARFKRFKGFGIEGELWEQEMEQAAELRRGLEGLAEQLGESVAWQMFSTSVGWSDAVPPLQTRLAIVDRTTGILRDIGIPPARVDELNRPWHRWVMSALARPIAERLRTKINENMERVDAGIRAEKKRRMAERPGTEEMTPEEAALVTKYQAMGHTSSQLDKMIRRDDYENLPRLLRQSIDQSAWLSPEDRQAIYQDCAEEFLDIDQYARERTIRRPEVVDR
jgi:hypothetical protein